MTREPAHSCGRTNVAGLPCARSVPADGDACAVHTDDDGVVDAARRWAVVTWVVHGSAKASYWPTRTDALAHRPTDGAPYIIVDRYRHADGIDTDEPSPLPPTPRPRRSGSEGQVARQ